jgi:hypothetical protein
MNLEYALEKKRRGRMENRLGVSSNGRIRVETGMGS